MATRCDVCSQEILSFEQILPHVLLHQTQLLALTKKLERAGCGISSPCQGPGPSIAVHSAANTDRFTGRTNGFEETDRTVDNDHVHTSWELDTPVNHVNKLKCPLSKCGAKRFSRKQDLVRHYSSHYDYNRPCNTCKKNFTKAIDLMKHQCSQSTARQREAIRLEIEQKLGLTRSRRSRCDRVRNLPVESGEHPHTLPGHRLDASVVANNFPRPITQQNYTSHTDTSNPTLDGGGSGSGNDCHHVYGNSFQNTQLTEDPSLWNQIYSSSHSLSNSTLLWNALDATSRNLQVQNISYADHI